MSGAIRKKKKSDFSGFKSGIKDGEKVASPMNALKIIPPLPSQILCV